MKIKPFVNIHCHFMNLSHLPDEYTKKMIHEVTNIKFGEKFASKLLSCFPVFQISKFCRALNVDNMWGENGTVYNYLKYGEFIAKGDRYPITKDTEIFDIVAPLMMDMVTSSNINIIDNHDGVIPFTIQLYEYSFFTAQFPWQIFPFVMFNPHRKESLNMCKEAIGNFGFVGIKMYPAHGFYPDFKSKGNKSEVNKRLIDFYNWVDRNELPIVSHSQFDSMQNISYTDEQAMKFTEIKNWDNVLNRYKKIRINFAHFGGTEFTNVFKKLNKKKKCIYEFSKNCRNQIINFMDNKKDYGDRIFADVAANNIKNYGKKEKKYYLDELNDILNKYPDRIMFGTDTPAISNKISDQNFIKIFKNGIKNNIDYFYSLNSLKFLFGPNYKIPDNYINYLKRSYIKGFVQEDPFDKKNLKEWIIKKGDKYYINPIKK